MKKQLALVIDIRKCTGCKSCVIACKTLYNTPLGKSRIRIIKYEKKINNVIKRIYVPIMCFQCEKPNCITACNISGSKAISKRKEDGIVIIDEKTCSGEKICIKEGCPYSNIFFNLYTTKADKCNLCIDNKWNISNSPACVNSCNAKALIYGDINNSSSDAGIAVNNYIKNNGKPLKLKNSPDGTKPSTIYLGIEKFIKEIDKSIKGFTEINAKDLY